MKRGVEDMDKNQQLDKYVENQSKGERVDSAGIDW